MKGRLAAVVVGVAVLAGTILASGVSCTSIRTRVWMNEGNKLYKAQRYDEAVEFYKKIIAIDPGNWTANYLIAMSYTALYHPGSEHEKDKEYVDKATQTFEKLMGMQAPDKDTEDRVRNYYVALLLAASKTDKVKQMERVDKGRGGTYLGDGSRSRGMASSTAHFLRRRGWHGLEYGLPQLLRETASVSEERGRGMHTRTERIAACRAERERDQG